MRGSIMYYVEPYTIGGELYHYGVKGMKWGVRKAMNDWAQGIKKKHKAAKEKIAKRLRDYYQGEINKGRALHESGYKSKKAKHIGEATLGGGLVGSGSTLVRTGLKRKNYKLAALGGAAALGGSALMAKSWRGAAKDQAHDMYLASTGKGRKKKKKG